MEIVIWVLWMAAGFVLLMKGADWFVDGAAGIAEKLGIPQLVIGLTIVAMGTSAPEAAVSISAALKGNADITVGNIVGSNLFNVLVILGITAVIIPTAVAKSTIRRELPFMVAVTVALLVFGYTGNSVCLWEGAVLWGLFLLYLAYLIVMARKRKGTDAADADSGTGKSSQPLWRQALLTAGGLAAVIVGSDLTVDAATAIAGMAGVGERLIGLTIVAMGTSLPELVTSVAAARKGNAGIAIGNIVGSNIFNILFVIGTTAWILPVSFAPGFVSDTVIAVGSGILLWLCALRSRRLSRGAGAVMLLCYAVYFVWLLTA